MRCVCEFIIYVNIYITINNIMSNAKMSIRFNVDTNDVRRKVFSEGHKTLSTWMYTTTTSPNLAHTDLRKRKVPQEVAAAAPTWQQMEGRCFHQRQMARAGATEFQRFHARKKAPQL